MEERIQFEDIPGRIFLDTSVVNFILDYGEQIHEDASIPERLSERRQMDINALRWMWLTGQRASWQLVVSPYTLREIQNTKNPDRRAKLENWFWDLWGYWITIAEEYGESPQNGEFGDTWRQLVGSGYLDVLKDDADKRLVCHAVTYSCDCFCTRDWRTILKHKATLSSLGLQFLAPSEWWGLVKPYAALWY